MNGKSLTNTTLPRSDSALVRCSYLVKENITKKGNVGFVTTLQR